MDRKTTSVLEILASDEGFGWLVDRHESERNTRMQRFATRLDIDNEAHLPLVNKRIGEVFRSDRAKREVKQFAATGALFNPLKRLTDRVTVAYKHQPVRRLQGQDETVNEAWHEVTRKEGKIHVWSQTWGRYAFLLNCVHVVPWVREIGGSKVLRYETILPHQASVTPSTDDPHQPGLLMYDVCDPAQHEQGSAMYVVLGSDGWAVIDEKGAPLRMADGRPIKRHAFGRCPAVPFRTRLPPPGDYWAEWRGQSLADLSVDGARVVAAMSWMRKSQMGKIMVTVAPEEAIPEGSTVHPESGMDAYADPDQVRVDVLNMETGIDEFAKETRYMLEMVAEGFGIPVVLIDAPGGVQQETGSAEHNAAAIHAALAEVRDSQIDVLSPSEHDLAVVTAMALEELGHMDAGRFPAGMVDQSFEVRYAPMTFADHPRVRARVYDDWLRLGVMSPAEVYQQEHPELTLEQCRERQEANDEERMQRNLRITQHGAADRPMNDTDSPEQAVGREGGRPAINRVIGLD